MAFLAQVPTSELSSSSSVIRLLMAQISMPKHEVTLWVSRILSVVLAALYAIPLFGVNPYFCYRAALISSIVASTMLLWQRFPCVEVSKLLLKDSCYYLLYSTLFLTASPITLALLPLVMLTISQCCSATILKSFDLVVPTSSYGFNIFLSFMESQQENVIFCSACFEVILLFILAFMPFLEGLSLWSLLLPLIYYHLFHYRYAAEMNLLALYSKFYSIGLSVFVSVLFGNQLLFSARQHQRGGLCCIECRLQSSDCVMPTMMLLGHIPMGKMSRSPSIIELIASKTETTLWVSRTLSIMFATLYYTISLFGVNPYIFYRATLISSIITSGTLLRKKWPSIQLNRVLLEDNCHYLLYSILFLIASPILLALLPLVIHSGLHCSAAALKLFHKKGSISTYGTNKFSTFIENQQQNILLLVAFSEVILLVVIPFAEGLSIWSLVLPIMYYYLLRHRYAAEVNPFAVKKLSAKQLDLKKLKEELEKYESNIQKRCEEHFAVVHLWKPKVWISRCFPFARVQVGHLALTLPDRTHISLWPDGKKELKEDIELEQRLPDEFIVIPTDEFIGDKLLHSLPLDGCGNFPKHCLHQSEVKIWWEKCANQGYSILRNNCAQTVQKALLAGDLETEKLDWLPVLGEINHIDWLYHGRYSDCLVEPPMELVMTDDIKTFLAALQEKELISSVRCFNSIDDIQSVDAAALKKAVMVGTKQIESLSHETRRKLTDDLHRFFSESGIFNWLPFRHVLSYTIFCFNNFLCNDVLWDMAMKNEEAVTLVTNSILRITRDNPHYGYISVCVALIRRIRSFSVQERNDLFTEVRNLLCVFTPEISAHLLPVPGFIYNYVRELASTSHN